MAIDVSGVYIRAATTGEVVSYLHEVIQTEGWIPAVADSRIFAEAAPGGVFIALHRDTQPQENGDVANDDILGCISTNGRGTPAGYVGHFVVRKDARGLGIGGMLFDRALDHLKDCDTIGLDAVLHMEPYYARRGFKRVYETARLVSTEAPDLATKWHPSEESAALLQSLGGDDYEVVDPRAHVDAVTEYEASISGLVRPGHIRGLLFATADEPPCGQQLQLHQHQQQHQQHQNQHGHVHASPSASVAVGIRHKPSGKIVAFGAVRPGTSAYARIAPLYADSPDLAVAAMRVLLLSYYARHGDKSQKAFMDVTGDPAQLPRVLAFLQAVDQTTRLSPMTEMGRFARMWTNGFPPGHDHAKMYALLSIEQG